MAKKGKTFLFKLLHRQMWRARGRCTTLDIWEGLHEVSDGDDVGSPPDESTISKYERLSLTPSIKYWQWLQRAGFTDEEVNALVLAVHMDLAMMCMAEFSGFRN